MRKFDNELEDHIFLQNLLEAKAYSKGVQGRRREPYNTHDAVNSLYTGSLANLFGVYFDPRQTADPFSHVCKVECDVILREALKTLPNKRYLLVVTLRFGLFGNSERTLKEIGVILRVTPERVRQMEMRALRILRHPSRSWKLKQFYKY